MTFRTASYAAAKPASATIVPSPFAVLREGVRRLFDGYAKRAKRHEVERMMGLDDHLLADIGVTRDDVHYALSRDEPSRALARSASVRRRR